MLISKSTNCIILILQRMAEQFLKVQFENSESTVEHGCPIFVPRPGVEGLHSFAEHARQHYQSIGLYIFRVLSR